jgi:hypothetical protein
VGPKNFIAGSIASILGTVAFHIVTYCAAVMFGLPPGWQAIDLKFGSFQSSQ